MSVPGLSGTAFQRQKQLYEKLGSPMGKYVGNASQNNYLIGQVRAKNYGSAPAQAAAAPQTQAATQQTLANQYAEMAGAKNVYKGPVFSEVLPLQKAWDQFDPLAQQEAEAQINPFVNRQLRQDSRNMYAGLASSGGGRFGRAMGGIGSLQADAERNRNAQIYDWKNTRRQGFEELFYNPSEKAFNRAIELGQTPTTPKVPTWNELFGNSSSNPFQPLINT